MDCGLPCEGNINFPILTVTGTPGTNGTTGADGVVIVYDNTPATAFATKTTGWETFENAGSSSFMSSGAITNLATAGDKILIVAVFKPSTALADRAAPQNVRVSIDGVAAGAASSYTYTFTTGSVMAKFMIEATLVSATSLHLDITVITTTTRFEAVINHFTETIAVTDATDLSAGILAQGDSAIIGDLLCEQLSVHFLNI